jgi:hypothetical protein
VTARVFESANDIVRTAADDNRLAQFLKEFVGSRRGQFAHVSRRQPSLEEYLLDFESIEGGIAVSPRRQRRDRWQIGGIFSPQPLSPKVLEKGGVVSVSAHVSKPFCPTAMPGSSARNNHVENHGRTGQG